MSSKEMNMQAIENLLPDEEGLFSGLNHELGHTAYANDGNNDEDFDLFSTVGGMEIEGDCHLHPRQGNFDSTEGLFSDRGSSNGSLSSESSRTIFVRNIDSSVEDSELRVLFEQYGHIRTLYTACRYQGFVIVSYYDKRAARSAMSSLQNKPVGYGKLDIQYLISKDNPSGKYIDEGILEVFNLASPISSDKLLQIFGCFGEIEQISGTTQYQKLIKYYDIRAAEAALHRWKSNDVLQEQIKVEVSRPIGGRRLIQQFSPNLVQDELKLCQSPKDNTLPQAVSPGNMPPSWIKNGYNYSVHSASEMSINAFAENSVSQVNSGFTSSLPSNVGNTPVCNQFGYLCLDGARLCNIRTNPQLLPQYHDGCVHNGVLTHSPLSNIPNLATDIGPIPVKEINAKHLGTVDSDCGMEHLSGCFSRTDSFPLDGRHLVWGNSNSFEHHPRAPVMWSNSPPFAKGVCAYSSSNMPVLFEPLPNMLYPISPTYKNHIRSAPSGNLSLVDLRHPLVGKTPKASDLHLDPLRIVGFPTSSMLHSSKVDSHSISHADGKCLDMSLKSAMISPQNLCHIVPGKDAVTSTPVSFTSPKERSKKLSVRKQEPDSCHVDQRKYELDIGRVLRGEDKRTTLMIRNIPNKYTSKTLLAAIDEQNRGTYDFIYLPIDFKNKCNMGYAFINMIDPVQIIPFYKTFNGKKWEKFHSGKVASLAYARIQGRTALISHFQDSSLMNEDKFCHPILFVADGPKAGDQEPFPMGTSTRSRPNKTRYRVIEENRP